jgi:hypothetical protein
VLRRWLRPAVVAGMGVGVAAAWLVATPHSTLAQAAITGWAASATSTRRATVDRPGANLDR